MSKTDSKYIELKEISPSYPSLQDEKEWTPGEEIKSNNPKPQPKHLPIPNVPRPVSSNVTPVVNVSATPQGPSFVEQQRARNSVPVQVAVNREAEINREVQPQNGLPPGYSIVYCSGCRGAIQYPSSVSIVGCTVCRATTATRPLVNIVCYYCRNSAYYPADQAIARCRCGMIYNVRPA